jgi:magnesium transporter
MPTQSPQLIDVLKERIQRKDWDGAIKLLAQLRDADEAELFSELGIADKRELLPHITYDQLARLLENLKKDDIRSLSQQADKSVLSCAIDKISPERAADVLHSLPVADGNKVLTDMAEKGSVSPLLAYSDESAGGMMTPEFIALTPEMSAGEAILLLRKLKPPRDTIDVLYVLDKNKTLLGRLTLRELILADPLTRVNRIMEHDVISVTDNTDREECARIMQHHSLAALPVTDGNQHLVGLIRLKDSIQVAEEEATEDMYHMIGLSEHERVFGPMRDSLKRRLPWLCINLGTAILAGFVVNLFESTIAMVVALAAFIPIIAGQGGNAGAQTLTIVVRSMALGEVSSKNARRAIFKEIKLAAVNGFVVAIVAGVVASLWKGEIWLGVVLAVAMFLTMMVAGISGALVPLILKLFRIDPALASTVVVTTVTDVCGFIFLLGVATILINYLV